jgi:hypothetical protein
MFILEENDLECSIKEEVLEPEEDENKEKYKNNLVREKRSIVDSIKDHLIPHVSSLKMSNKMIDSLS